MDLFGDGLARGQTPAAGCAAASRYAHSCQIRPVRFAHENGDVLAGVSDVSCALPAGAVSADIQGLAYDSRKVGADYLFFAFSGSEDGRGAVCNAARRRARMRL